MNPRTPYMIKKTDVFRHWKLWIKKIIKLPCPYASIQTLNDIR